MKSCIVSTPQHQLERSLCAYDTAGTRVSTGRRGKEWGTGPRRFMGVPITDEISWMTDSRVADFVGWYKYPAL